MAIWIDIPQFPNHQGSSDGEIRNKHTGLILKPFSDRYGYLRVSIGNVDNVYIHRIICELFHGQPENEKMQVNHIDCNRQNNRSDNLEWCTASENIKWAINHGCLDPSIGLAKAREVNLKPVRIIELDKTFSSVKECAEFLGINPNRVSRCLVGERKGQRLHGYHIEYVRKEM